MVGATVSYTAKNLCNKSTSVAQKIVSTVSVSLLSYNCSLSNTTTVYLSIVGSYSAMDVISLFGLSIVGMPFTIDTSMSKNITTFPSDGLSSLRYKSVSIRVSLGKSLSNTFGLPRVNRRVLLTRSPVMLRYFPFGSRTYA